MVLEFAAKKAGKKPKCVKGYPCGGSCINRKRNCKAPLEGQAGNFADWLKKQGEGDSKGKETAITSKKVAVEPKESVVVEPKKSTKKKEKKPKEATKEERSPDPIDKLKSASNFKLENPAFLAEIGREFAEKYLKGTKKDFEARKEYKDKLALLEQRKQVLDDEYIGLLSTPAKNREQSLKTMARVSEIESLQESLSKEVSLTIRTEPTAPKAQFDKLRQAIASHHNLSDSKVKKLVKSVDKRSLSRQAKKEADEALSEIVALTGRNPDTFKQLISYSDKKPDGAADEIGNTNTKRAYASEVRRTINIGANLDSISQARFRSGVEGEQKARVAAKSVLYHEFAHHLEYTDKSSQKAVNKWIDRRTKGEKAQKLAVITGNKNYRDDEVAKPDDFVNPYIGKKYSGKDSTEALSMGVQEFALDLFDEKISSKRSRAFLSDTWNFT